MHSHHNMSSAYAAAQSALAPVTERPLQVDDALAELERRIDFITETVQVLIRRLEPVTGEVLATTEPTPDTGLCKVRLAEQIDGYTLRLSVLTASVQATVRALQL